MKFLRWIIWNCCISGFLVAGYFLDAHILADKVIFGYYIFATVVYFFAALSISSMEYIEKIKDKVVFSTWNYFEFIWITAAILMGYNRIAVLMILEFFLFLYVYVSIKVKSKES